MERAISLAIVLLLGVFRKQVVVAVVLEVVCPVDIYPFDSNFTQSATCGRSMWSSCLCFELSHNDANGVLTFLWLVPFSAQMFNKF